MNFLDFIEPVLNSSNIGLTNELKAIYIYNAFNKFKRGIVVVTNSVYGANQLYLSLLNYTNDVLLFPMDDFLTSEALAISPEFKTTRIEVIDNVIKNSQKIVITNLMGYLRYLPEKEIFKQNILNIKKGMTIDINTLSSKFMDMGYVREEIVNKTGEFALRGFVVDIFPTCLLNPIRIEFWGDEIDSIRYFDVDNQRTIEEIEKIDILPNTEFLVENLDNVPFDDRKQKNLKKYTTITNITSYLQEPIVIFNEYNYIKTSYTSLQEEMFNYSLSLGLDGNTTYMNAIDDIKTPNYIYFSEFMEENISVENTLNYKCFEIEGFTGTREEINKRLNNYLSEQKTVIICVKDRYKANRIIDNLENKKITLTDVNNICKDNINIIIKNVNSGFIYKNYCIITEKEIFNQKENNSVYKTKFKMGSKIKDITKLQVGDYIVHYKYGIGRYAGIKTLIKNGLKRDYLQLEYKGEDKLYIPVEKIDLISKYSSNGSSTPKINSLNSTEWEKTKLRVKKKIEDIASSLISLYAKREAAEGFAFSKDSKDQVEFEKQFAFTETIDQIKVIDEIKKDMESKRPMDRLLCGDVGYGKTEVAFRAMFKAVYDGKQVALLCPTTILSNQHFKNAIERFKDFPVNIAMLNRFVTGKKKDEIIKKVNDGKIDILIGTHRILSDDIKFKDLGLLVIDEEQRFGVKHKEKIKEYKNNVDVLTLSATPIPRTLQMSMAGIRSLSLIETPPVDRYPIQTYVLQYNKQIIKDAIYKELSRDGQVFILYNNIENMLTKQAEIQKLVPEAKIIVAHGKMDKSTLEDVMLKFINKEFNVLLCTTIIETGIDIPSANTLIIMDADRFGLSQLYQIRGRVGRSNKIAYCYLMYDANKILNEIAIKRLKVIKEFTELGSGFSIAMRDLSIRGAGDIIGSEQSGFVDSVGIELFMKMLNDEIERLKGNIVEEKEEISEPLVSVETAISDDYILDEDLKIYIHRKINTIDSYEKLNEIKSELEDRFGKIDENLFVYMHEEYFEKMAQKLNITQIKQTKNFIEIYLNKKLTSTLDGQKLFMEVSTLSRMFRFSMKLGQLVITLDTVKLDKHFIYYLIDLLKIIENCIKK